MRSKSESGADATCSAAGVDAASCPFCHNLVHDEGGAALFEYAILIVLIAVVCVGAVTTLGGTIVGFYTSSAAAF
jgi:Flp pilus assembly pilin Flp